MRVFFAIVYLTYISQLQSQDMTSKATMLSMVNELRLSGCQCGNEYMVPVDTVRWDDALEKTAEQHAKEMNDHDYFSHKSLQGKNIGQRLDQAGYIWQFAGENLAEGQKSFEEAFNDWLESPSHCKMLMNPRMQEMGISRYGKFWVQHFGTKMPPKTVRKKVYYREG